MTSATTTMAACPSREQWLNWVLDGAVELAQVERTQHLASCAACSAEVSDIRRFQGLLQRGRAPALSPEQRQSLDERIRLQAGVWERPSRMAPWLVWGTALAAATAVALLVARPFGDGDRPVAAGPAVAATAHWHAEVEGRVEVARADGHWQAASNTVELVPGLRVRSTAGARLTVAHRFEAAIAAGGEFDVMGLGPNHTDLRVRHGEVEWQVAKQHPGQRFAVMFGGFRASVVGTRFWVRQSSDGSDGQVQVSEGAVRVDAADEPTSPMAETTTVVRAGQRWRHSGGVMLLEPSQAVVAPRAPTPHGAEAEPVAVETAAPGPSSGAPQHPPVRAKPKAPRVESDTDRQILIEVPPQTMPPPDSASEGLPRQP